MRRLQPHVLLTTILQPHRQPAAQERATHHVGRVMVIVIHSRGGHLVSSKE